MALQAEFKGQTYAYTAGGSVSSYGHNLEYRFDWGDGTYSLGPHLPLATNHGLRLALTC